MALSPLTEEDLIDQIYSAYENDNSTWSSSSAEYLTARRLCKAAIIRWEYLEGMQWPELFTKLQDAADGTKTTTANDYDYSCPTDMRIPPKNYVRLESPSGATTILQVVPLSKVEQLDDSQDHFCYFTGNAKLGYTLNINPRLNLSTGDTINYDYYRNATYFTTTTSTTEMANPMFIVHFVLHRLYKNDGLLRESSEEFQVAENLLQEMKAEAQTIIQDDLSSDISGFGV